MSTTRGQEAHLCGSLRHQVAAFPRHSHGTDLPLPFPLIWYLPTTSKKRKEEEISNLRREGEGGEKVLVVVGNRITVQKSYCYCGRNDPL